jgi:hypothetical protein
VVRNYAHATVEWRSLEEPEDERDATESSISLNVVGGRQRGHRQRAVEHGRHIGEVDRKSYHLLSPERIEAMWPRGGVNRPAHRI